MHINVLLQGLYVSISCMYYVRRNMYIFLMYVYLLTLAHVYKGYIQYIVSTHNIPDTDQ